jgi:hypothetical protein
MLKYLILLLLFSLIFTTNAEAANCRSYNNQEVCIISIKRSAKYYWEYRVVLSIDGERQPKEIYDCRYEVKRQVHDNFVPFEPNDPAKLICGILKH